MTALPAQLPSPLSQSTIIRDAYSTCLRFEQYALTCKNPTTLISARILGYLILHAPSIETRSAVVEGVISCNGDTTALEACGNTYFNYFIYPFKRNVGHGSRSASYDLSLPYFDTCEEMITSTFVEAPKSYQEAKQNALIRDSFRCVITGKYDRHMMKHNQEVAKLADSLSGTSCLYIIPNDDYREITGEDSPEFDCPPIFAEVTDTSESGKIASRSELHYLSSIWDVMDHFGYEQVRFDLEGNKINSLENLLTMTLSAHDLFGALLVWFERTDTPHVYAIGATYPGFGNISDQPIITLTSPDPEKFPLPSPTYLEIHAFCAKVAHFSGAGDYIELNMEDSSE